MVICNLIILLCIAAHQVHGSFEATKRIDCEPVLEKVPYYFIQRYNMTIVSKYFMVRELHRSNHLYPDVIPGSHDLLLGNKVARSYRQLIDVKMTEQFEPARQLPGMIIIINFYFGDSGTCHMFNPKTGKYKRVEIGFHTRRFTCIVPMDYISTVDFEKHGTHNKNSFAVIGVTLVRANYSSGEITIFSKDELLARFPQHKSVIDIMYSRIGNMRLSKNIN